MALYKCRRCGDITGKFGDYPICSQNYIDCKHYQKIIAKKIEEYNKDRIEVLK